LIPAYFALGFGGQKIFVFPEEKMVIVFTSGNYVSKDYTMVIMKKFFLPSLDY